MVEATPFTVLHVCMGNICRSPMAERLLVVAAHELVGDKVDDLLYSHGAGTGRWHVGQPMDEFAAREVRRRGGDPDSFRARYLSAEYIEASDLILTATAEQMEFVVGLVPEAQDRVFVLGEFDRLLASIDPASLPRFAPDADTVYARGTAMVMAATEIRQDRPPLPGDEIEDPWGSGPVVFAQIADGIEAVVRRLASVLLK